MQIACRRCGSMLEGAAGSRTVCSQCGNVMVLPAGSSAPPARGAARAPGSFSPMVEPATPLSPPGAALGHGGPKRNSVPAILALIFGILPWLLVVPSYAFGGDPTGAVPLGSSFGIIGIGFGIAAIVLGIIGLRQCNREPHVYKGKGMAIAGLTLGIVFTALWVIALIVILVLCVAYISSYGKSSAIMAPCPAVALQAATTDPRLRKEARLRMLFAHHPECSAFDADVIASAGLRFCASCTAFATTATLATFTLLVLPPTATVAQWLIAAGALLIFLPQLLSVLRWTHSRARKMMVKAPWAWEPRSSSPVFSTRRGRTRYVWLSSARSRSPRRS